MSSGVSSIGGMSAEQIRQALFNKLDVNHDGVLDKSEIRAALESDNKNSVGFNKSAFADQVFAKLDANGDGAVSQSEFNAALSKAQQSSGPFLSGSTASLVGYLASGLDQNKTTDPTLTQTNAVNTALKNYLAQCGQLSQKQATATVSALV